MAERQITFIDADDNPLTVRFGKERVQLVVVDSEPALEGGELRALASALFGAYVGGPLARRLTAAAGDLERVRQQLAKAGGDPQVVATLASSLQAVAEIGEALAAAQAAVGPSEPPPARPWGVQDRKPGRGGRLADGNERLGWGWVPLGDRNAAAS